MLLGLCTIGFAVWVWSWAGWSAGDRLVAIGDALAAGAFGLAVLAGVVAVLAYRVASQRPQLTASWSVSGSTDGVIVGLDAPDSAGERRIKPHPVGPWPPHGSLTAEFRIENVSEWSARNVAVSVEFTGMRGIGAPADWSPGTSDPWTGMVTGLEWEGGADKAIHGHRSRALPAVPLTGVIVDPPTDKCEIAVDVVAEGFHNSWTFRFDFRSMGGVFDGTRGSIEGYAGYPSSGVPSLRIYAVPVLSGTPARRVVIPQGPTGRLRWFRIDGLEPGQYHVLAYREGYPDLAGGYTIASQTNDFTAGANHTLVSVAVQAGQTTSDVRLTDWYAMGSFPPEPEGSELGDH